MRADDKEPLVCQNCERSWKEIQLRIPEDIEQRVEPGEPYPGGECPECGALCHAAGPMTATQFSDQEAATIQAALTYYYRQEQYDPDKRDLKMQAIACGSLLKREVISLDRGGLKNLIVRLRNGWRYP